uniref:Uncharacterized protein n=1 Tax=Megaselia scalaris TaxID=36166 RepID=T1GS65_MEGSC
MVFENLNSLETLNIQNNKLARLPEEIMEPLMDSLRVVDITEIACKFSDSRGHILSKKVHNVHVTCAQYPL